MRWHRLRSDTVLLRPLPLVVSLGMLSQFDRAGGVVRFFLQELFDLSILLPPGVLPFLYGCCHNGFLRVLWSLFCHYFLLSDNRLKVLVWWCDLLC